MNVHLLSVVKKTQNDVYIHLVVFKNAFADFGLNIKV